MAGMLCFMAESAVEQGYVGFELLLEDIDQGEIGPGAKRVVVELGRDPAADRLGVAAVAAAGEKSCRNSAASRAESGASNVSSRVVAAAMQST